MTTTVVAAMATATPMPMIPFSVGPIHVGTDIRGTLFMATEASNLPCMRRGKVPEADGPCLSFA